MDHTITLQCKYLLASFPWIWLVFKLYWLEWKTSSSTVVYIVQMIQVQFNPSKKDTFKHFVQQTWQGPPWHANPLRRHETYNKSQVMPSHLIQRGILGGPCGFAWGLRLCLGARFPFLCSSSLLSSCQLHIGRNRFNLWEENSIKRTHLDIIWATGWPKVNNNDISKTKNSDLCKQYTHFHKLALKTLQQLFYLKLTKSRAPKWLFCVHSLGTQFFKIDCVSASCKF